jgi:hypothetical protein
MTEPLPAAAAAAPPVLDTLPFAVLIDEAWRSTRAWGRAILLPAAMLIAPAALLIQVAVGMANLSLVGMDPASFEPARFCGTLALGALAALIVGVYYTAVQSAVMIVAVRSLASETPSLRRGLRFYVRPRVWGTDLLAALLVGLGLMACILPGLFLAAAWSLRLAVMVREERFGWDALRRSWELLAHNPSGQLLRHPVIKVLLVFVLGGVLACAVSMLVQMPAVLVNQVMMVRAMGRGEAVDPQELVRATLWLSIPAGVLAALAQLFVQLYVDFATAHLYYDQVRRKEGADLSAALDRLLGATPPAPAPPAL